jgi:hypothetical protein
LGFYDLCMLDPELLERITARRAELDELEERLSKELAEVWAERDELAVAERILERVCGQLAEEHASDLPAPGQFLIRVCGPRCRPGWNPTNGAIRCRRCAGR